jgi:cytochrome P450
MALLSLLQDGAVIHPLVLLPVFSLVLAIGYLLFDVVYNLFFNPLRRFPGPKLWAISNIPYTRMFLSGKGHYKMRQLHQEYGPIVRIGPKDLSINHPDGMKDLRGHRKTGTGENSKDPVLAQFNADNIIGANRQDHQRFRRVVAHGFSHQSMVDQEPIIAGYVDKFINGLHEVCTNGTKPLDIAAWFNFATFDIIGDLAFGEPFGCLDNKELHPWVSLIFAGVKDLALLSCLTRYPWLNKLIMSLMPKSLNSSWEAHRDTSREKVRKRLASKEDRPDFIDAMIRRTGASGNEMPFEELASNAQVIILAGSETTATLLTATTYFLTTNPETLKKLSDEVRSSFKSESEIDMASVQRLPYMLAVLNEGLRLFPPVINGIQRKVREGGDTIINQYIPGGVSVDIWQWAVYHNPDHFALPDEYIPERWLDDPRFVNDAKRALAPFSIGPRDCVGKNLAYAEMRLILARLLWNFDIRLDPKSAGWDHRSKSYFIWERGPLNVFLTPRGSPGQV